MNRHRYPTVTPEQEEAVKELADAEFSVFLFERYNPKYLPAVQERVRKAKERIQTLIRRSAAKET